MKLRKEQIFLIIIISIIILAGSGLLIWQTMSKNKFIITGLQGENMDLTNNKPEVEENSSGEEKKEVETEYIYVHITGAVKNSGVYKLEENARVIDALDAAGGESKNAALSKINLAARIGDGDQIYIPDKNDPNSTDSTKVLKEYINKGNIVKNTSGATGKIALNSAGKSQLEELPGIGPSKAQNILEYRKKIGKFESYQQLLSVKGIGEKTLEKIKSELSLK